MKITNKTKNKIDIKSALKIRTIIILIAVILIRDAASIEAAIDYKLDLSPEIRNQKMFNAGLGIRYSEYNGMFFDGTLYYNENNDENITYVASSLSMVPYFEYRPLSFLELGLSMPISYNKHEQYSTLINSFITETKWTFDAIHSYAKIAIVDWIISLGFRMDFAYNFSDTFGSQNNFDIYSKIFIAIVPKVIPFNLLLNYQQGLDKSNMPFGIAQAAIELVSSELLIFSLGANYMFPYGTEDITSSIEAFANVSLFFDDFISGNVSYSKVFYGEGVGNNSTFLIDISYHF